MKKIFLTVLFCLPFTSAAFADYGRAVEYVRAGNYSQAFENLRETAGTDPKSQYLMGFMYYYGLGVDHPNYQKAFDYFKLSSQGGNTDARTFLAYMYDEGKGIQQSKKKAFELYQQAADAGDVTATINLAVMYYQGQGVPQSFDKAFSLMNSVEDVRNPIVQFYLGNFYFYGLGTMRDVKKGVTYYIRSAQLDSVDAHYMLGYIYQNGLGADVDLSKAAKYYEYAAMKNHPQAQFNLATMYADGKIGSVDKISAYMWLAQSVKGNFTKAQEALSKLSETMSLSEISRAKENLIDLGKNLATASNMKSIAMSENIGDKSFSTEAGASAFDDNGDLLLGLDNQENGKVSPDGIVRLHAPRMKRRRR